MIERTSWWAFVQRELDERGWTTADLARVADFDRSLTARWKAGKEVSVGNVRAVATAFGVPLLQALVQAGIITEAEAGMAPGPVEPVPTVPHPQMLSNEALLREVRRRIEAGTRGVVPSSDGLRANPEVIFPDDRDHATRQDV